MTDPIVRVDGIRELNKALRDIDRGAARELRVALRSVADAVIAKTKPKVPYLTGSARSSYRARTVTGGAAVAFGNARTPYTPWLEYGGSVGRGHRPRRANSGSVKRPRVEEGRYLYPTLREQMPEVERMALGITEDIATRYGLRRN